MRSFFGFMTSSAFAGQKCASVAGQMLVSEIQISVFVQLTREGTVRFSDTLRPIGPRRLV